MPKDPQTLVFVGIKHSVLALDARTGAEVWRTKLHGSDFVSLLWDGESLVAGNGGEVFCLDPATGEVRWHHELHGLGRGVVSLASSRAPMSSSDAEPAMAKRRRDQQAAAGAAAGG